MERAENACVLLARLGAVLFALLLLLFLAQYVLLAGHAPLTKPSASALAAEDRLVVPPLVHYTWYSLHRHTFRFHHLVSLLSARRFLKPRQILFWCGSEPRGRWWSAARRKVPELRLRIRPPPTQVRL